ncbi:hypothetical protein [Kitasatospora sp. NPDC088346]|uniref:hypothetical protein n=1 Tax=Kitasatospora sp. NPDC088346 TaxID=3364073 RepID=UPI00380AD641
MVTFRDFLARFRPTGAPGASATGVPADRAAELTAELGPSLAELTQAQEEADGRTRPAVDRVRLGPPGPGRRPRPGEPDRPAAIVACLIGALELDTTPTAGRSTALAALPHDTFPRLAHAVADSGRGDADRSFRTGVYALLDGL